MPDVSVKYFKLSWIKIQIKCFKIHNPETAHNVFQHETLEWVLNESLATGCKKLYSLMHRQNFPQIRYSLIILSLSKIPNRKLYLYSYSDPQCVCNFSFPSFILKINDQHNSNTRTRSFKIQQGTVSCCLIWHIFWILNGKAGFIFCLFFRSLQWIRHTVPPW